jgi:hypothetical protein
MRLVIIYAALLLFGLGVTPGLPVVALAQEPGGDRLVENEAGFAIGLAGGFQLGRREDGYYLLGSRSLPGLILVKPLAGLTAAELAQGMQSGFHDSGAQLTPDGVPSELTVEGASGKIVEVSGVLNRSKVRGLLAGYLRTSGGGLLLFAVTAPEQWLDLKPVAEQIARGVTLFEPDVEELIRFWKERLSGFRLAPGPAGDGTGGRPEKKAYALCGNGSFLDAESAARAENRKPNGAPSGNEAGRWAITARNGQATIVFTFPDGQEESYQLSRQEHETYLDGQRYFVLPDDLCR